MSAKSSPRSPIAKSPFKFFRGFPKKQRKSLKIAVLGGSEVGKSAFVVRYLTKRYIGDYCSKLENTYPYNAVVDNTLIPLVVWDTSIPCNQGSFASKLTTIMSWCDVIILIYSVTDSNSHEFVYQIFNLLHNYLYNDVEEKYAVPILLVGNKNDLWQQRQVVTDKACQRAKDSGFSNFFEISVKQSLDQVRIVFEDAIRRGLSTRRHRRGHARPSRHMRKSMSADLDLSEQSEETSPESEDLSTSPKTIVNIPSTILLTIRKKLSSPKPPENPKTPVGSIENSAASRSRSFTYSGKFKLNGRERKLSVFEPSALDN